VVLAAVSLPVAAVVLVVNMAAVLMPAVRKTMGE
jgi:hypothetical protein